MVYPTPSQGHQEVPCAYCTTNLAIICASIPQKDAGYGYLSKSLIQLWRALAQLRRALASSGEIFKMLRGAARSWILGRNEFLWSCKVKLYILGAFWAFCAVLANLARARHQLRQSQTPTSKSHNCPSTRSFPRFRRISPELATIA